MIDKIRLGIIILILVLIGSGITLAILYTPVRTDSIILTIDSGDSARVIAQKLHSLGIIRSPFIFLELVRISGSDRFLKKGTYVFEGRISLMGTIRILKEGRSQSISITIPEGFSMYRALQRIDRSGLATFDELYRVATDTAFVRRATGFPVKSLEGFLYPETYRFEIGQSPERILEQQVRHFFDRVRQAGLAIDDQDSFYKTMILASIVEKEAVYADEKPVIAGVFLNRLRYGMNLASCPTVDYILERRGIRRAVLTYQDTSIKNPYNTYVYTGLPPTPICNPTIPSIDAVLNPQSHSYLYFFADNKGRNIFSSTYADHIARQQQRRRRQ